MASKVDKLISILESIKGTGKYCTLGKQAFFFPEISIFEETLAFPLPPSQVDYLISRAKPAPYGMGEETVLDEEVRKCWEIGAEEIKLPSKGNWTKYLRKISKQVQLELGIESEVKVDPYKMLIYEEGGHFLPHTDTEKISGMFGTLVVTLPSKHEGGELLIRHDGEEVSVKTDKLSKEPKYQHVAFFADCEHEVRPVTQGYRVCLVYNLAVKRKLKQKFNQGYKVHVKQLQPVLADLKDEIGDELKAVLLNHQYTEESFSLENLKNEDAIKAKVLMEAAEATGYCAYLGLVTLYQIGELEERGYYDGYESCYDDDEGGTMGEVYEEYQRVDSWFDARGKTVKLRAFPVNSSQFVPQIKLTDGEPSEKEVEGYTGNAGCTIEHWYRKAAVVMWNKEHDIDVLCRSNLEFAAETFARYKANGWSCAKARKYGGALIKEIQRRSRSAKIRNHGIPVDEVLNGIALLGSEELLIQCLIVCKEESLIKVEEMTWKKVFTTFGVYHFMNYFENLSTEMIQNNVESLFSAASALLSKPLKFEVQPLLGVIANRFMEKEFSPSAYSFRDTIPYEKQLHILIASSAYVKKGNRRALLKTLKFDISLWYVREYLGPALLQKTHNKHFSQGGSLASELWELTVKVLEKEVGHKLKPYSDMKRKYVPCDYGIRMFDPIVAKFFSDSKLKRFDVVAGQSVRDRLIKHIRKHQLDCDFQTIKEGRPYTLRLTKNSGSYKKVMKQRVEDKALYEKMRGGME